MSGLDHLPDVRDGLTHVERRLLHWMGAPGTKRRESRSVIDAARRGTDFSRRQMYEAVVRLAVEWSMRYPLLDGEGNFGSIDDDPPAESRYTDVRLAGRAEQVFGPADARVTPDAKRTTIDTTMALTGPLPNLLVNGASGGVASFPPHQLREVAQAALVRLDHSSASLDQVLAVMPGPDYPTGGQLVDRDELRTVYETGAGTVRLRGSAHIEVDDDEAHARAVAKAQGDPMRLGVFLTEADELELSPEELKRVRFVAPPRQRVVVTSIPFGTWAGGDHGMFMQAVDHIHEGPLAAIGNCQVESDRRGMRIVFEVRDGADPRVVRDLLFELTSLESELSVLMVALVEGRPEQLTLLDVIDHYLDHQRAVRSGSRDEVDAAITRDLQAFARATGDPRRTAVPEAPA